MKAHSVTGSVFTAVTAFGEEPPPTVTERSAAGNRARAGKNGNSVWMANEFP